MANDRAFLCLAPVTLTFVKNATPSQKRQRGNKPTDGSWLSEYRKATVRRTWTQIKWHIFYDASVNRTTGLKTEKCELRFK